MTLLENTLLDISGMTLLSGAAGGLPHPSTFPLTQGSKWLVRMNPLLIPCHLKQGCSVSQPWILGTHGGGVGWGDGSTVSEQFISDTYIHSSVYIYVDTHQLMKIFKLKELAFLNNFN